MAEESRSKDTSPSSSSVVETANFCLCQPEPKVPRPRNAFILYRQHQQAGVVALNPGLSNPDISKIIGEQWRSLPTKSKDEWVALAEEEKARHHRQYPDYRYKPRRNGRYSSQSSNSDNWNESTSDSQGSCLKCGRKRMNPPNTPYTPFTPVTMSHPQQMSPKLQQQQQQRRTYIVSAPQSARPPMTAPIVSPPYSARVRTYADMYGRPTQNHDPRPRYVEVRPPPSTPVTLDSPEPKRRRFNGNGGYGPVRAEIYPETPYAYSPRKTVFPRPEVVQARPTLAPPPRTIYSQTPTMQVAATHKPTSYHPKRDPSLTLPPLKTSNVPQNQTQPQSQLKEQSQQSGIEAMIMSVPVLNKIKVLSQISPCLQPPSVATPAPEIRGMIIAVEGMDEASVYSMTSSLAEQLERDGEFAVRIFGGPVPYTVDMEGKHLVAPLVPDRVLQNICEWHKISREMTQYITTKPRRESFLENSVSAHKIEDVLESHSKQQNMASNRGLGDVRMSRIQRSSGSESTDGDVQMVEPITPVEFSATAQAAILSGEDSSHLALSPSTISKASELAIASPDPKANPSFSRSHSTTSITNPSVTTVVNNAIVNHPVTRPSSPAPQLPRRPSHQIQPPPNPHSQPTNNHTCTHTPIPIALVPHYQLTSVDASAIAMPITDSYSPISHWQWLATLWRGCVGPDATVAIVSALHSTEEESATMTTTTPAYPAAGEGATGGDCGAGMNGGDGISGEREKSARDMEKSKGLVGGAGGGGVEVRLADARTVVVRRERKGGGNDRDEAWEKAKRRVGFEVAEFLKR